MNAGRKEVRKSVGKEEKETGGRNEKKEKRKGKGIKQNLLIECPYSFNSVTM